MKRPLWVMAVGWACGIGIEAAWKCSSLLWAVGGVLVLLIGGVIYLRRLQGLVMTLFWSALFFGATQFSMVDEGNQSTLPFSSTTDSYQARVTGTVASTPVVDGDRVKMELETRGIDDGQGLQRVKERVMVQLRLGSAEEKQAASTLRRGIKLRLPMTWTRPDPARNPGAFDYRTYLRRHFIHWTGEGDWGRVEILSRDPSLLGKIDEVRLWLGKRLDRIYSGETAGVMKGMLLGERDAVPVEAEKNLTALGLIHLLAISGLHVGVFVGCVYGTATLAGITREKAAMMTIFILPFYVLLTGAGAPVVRAGVMAALGLLAIMLGKWKDSLSFLGLACLLMLWWNPYQLLEAGFQLSFVITAALLLAVGPISRRLPTPWLRINQLLAVTLVAQVAAFPLLITHFNEFSLLSWGVNFLVVPLVTGLLIPLGTLSLVLGSFHEWAGALPAAPVTWIWSGIHTGLEQVAQWNRLRLSWSPLPGWWLAGYGVAALYLLWAFTGGGLRRARHGWKASACCLFLLLFSLKPGMWSEDALRITFLDVGQGDAAVIETPEGQVIVVDGGGRLPWEKEPWQRRREPYDVGERVLVPYLKYRGIREIDWMVMTHGDADHIGGLTAVAERFPVKRVLRTSTPAKGPLESQSLRKMKEKGIPVFVPEPGRVYRLEEGVQWQFLHPSHPAGESRLEERNDQSLVFLLTAYGRRILMTGDVEKAGEEDMLMRWHLPQVDLLKVAHHGSRTSTGEKWLQAVQPQEAVISVGGNNRYGHPSSQVLDRLKAQGARIWRTDLNGAVIVSIRPQSWKVFSMLGTPAE
ncbi:competence protein ComEC [Melghirimyces thermohalophilus]|uniref:Competence protein ComEC n=1 Tax=Melghirimyces thermohalophilus TaxID=1236220 RepID=A0A1G6P245_9BACL|nr:DNA internalization-related competence protein ComEC/Rec2 [Melghirimyces thermohalophilus]SDC73566.1 competence protein ComEC [Melghirimyces thermohalophilus]